MAATSPMHLHPAARTRLRALEAKRHVREEAGRTPALAELVEFYDDRIYDLEDFPEADAPQKGANGQGAQGRGDQAETVDRVRHALTAIPAVYLFVPQTLFIGQQT
jgi:hypothetical protein